MKAKKQPRIQTQGRPILENLIPIATPYIIFVDPSDVCNFRCHFCPTGDISLMKKTPGRMHGLLDFELYKKIINDLREFDQPIKVLRLYKDGEPTLHPRFPEMIRYAKESGCVMTIDTTTNASRLSPKLSEAMIDAGLGRINISIYGVKSEQYVAFSGAKIDFQVLVQNIQHLYEISRGRCIVNIKINGDVIPAEDVNRFYEIFGDICDEINDEHVMSCWPEFGIEDRGVSVNKLLGIYGQPITNVTVCPYIFYAFSINSDGTASTCFLDWERKLLIGDTRTQSVKSIWDGMALRAHQLLMLRGERQNHPICHNCGQLTHGSPDNIDPYRETLLQKLVQIEHQIQQ